MIEIKVSRLGRATDSASFKEARADELRVLIALLESSGEATTYAKIAEAAAVSEARARAATELWRAEGVIGDLPEKREKDDNVRDEFESRFSSDMYEERSVDTARSVRDGELSALLEECAALMGKAALSTEEVKKITSIYTQLSLSVEFILTLAMHLAEDGNLTVVRLAKRAESLVNSGIDTIEALGAYIENSGAESDVDMEFRRLFGIWNRKLSESNRSYFRKWSEEYGYSTEIVGEAYNIWSSNDATGRLNLKYIDTILTRWHESGCHTIAECRAQTERDRGEKKEQKGEAPTRKRAEKKPQFLDFDVDEAIKRALERSYGSSENDN